MYCTYAPLHWVCGLASADDFHVEDTVQEPAHDQLEVHTIV